MALCECDICKTLDIVVNYIFESKSGTNMITENQAAFEYEFWHLRCFSHA